MNAKRFWPAIAWPKLVLCVLACTSIGQSQDAVFDRAIQHQPFDAQPFRQVRIPDWVQSTLGCGYTLSVMDAAGRAEATRHGVTISEMGFVNPFFACYESRLIKGRSPEFPAGRIEQEIAEYKRLGIRILAVYPPCLQGEVYLDHPEWRRIDTNTTDIPSIDMEKYGHGGMLCLLGPYGDFMIDVLAEILVEFPDVDAFSFDGLHYGGVCYCQHCRESYRQATQLEIPAADMQNAEFRRYQHWADRKLEALVQRMQSRLKAIKPEVALITWSTNAGRFGHFLSIPRNMSARMNLLFDAPDQEFWLDEHNRGATIIPAFANAYIWATTNHRVAFSEPYLMSHGNPYGKDSFPGHEVLRRMMLALTYGAAPSIAVIQPPHLQPAIYDCLDQVQARKEWLTHKRPEPWCAVVMSDNTRNFYGQSPGLVEERYMSSVFGMFRACMEEHLPMNLINDWNLNDDDLANYQLLVLPNTACLDSTQMAAIERFVSRGGGLVASLDTSLFDEFGTPRENFGLSELLGLNYRGVPEVHDSQTVGPVEIDVNFAWSITPDYWQRRKNIFDFKPAENSFADSPRLTSYIGSEPVTFKGPAVLVQPASTDTQVTASLRIRGSADDFPAILARNHGQGRVVYFAAGIDSAYYNYAYPYQRIVMRDAMQWAANSAAPLSISAPMCVHSSFMRQSKEGHERLVIHLFNDVNTTAQHAFPNDDVPLREEVIPIHDIQVSLSSKYPVLSVYLEPGGLELEIQRTVDGDLHVVVPKLEVHAMVVCELEN